MLLELRDERMNMASAIQNTPITDSPRHTGEDPSFLGHVNEDQQKFYSCFQPELSMGEHPADPKQPISWIDSSTPLLTDRITSKATSIEAPRFVLPGECVHSVSPAEGERAPAETLPSIVFRDAHMPWERSMQFTEYLQQGENMPWLALLVFSRDEIEIAPKHLSGETSMFKGTDLATDTEKTGEPIQQSPTFAISMSLSDINTVKTKDANLVASPIPVDDRVGIETRTDVIFLRPALFNKLITTYENGAPKTGQTTADLSRYKYLAHVRQIKKSGVAASKTSEEDLLSVVLSHRIGSLNETKEQLAIVHLVSLENWQNMSLVNTDTVKYVVLNSLYSWTYTSMLTGDSSLVEAAKKLNRGLLGVPGSLIADLENRGDRSAVRLAQKYEDGYTLIRHRTQTGEMMPALFRGPLIPNMPSHPIIERGTVMSNFGTDLQILDQETGTLDVAYSAAWNLGKTLALADASFTTSLARLRHFVLARSLRSGKEGESRKRGGHNSKLEILGSLAQSMGTLYAMTDLDGIEKGEQASVNGSKIEFNQSASGFPTTDPSLNAAVKDTIAQDAENLAGTARIESDEGDNTMKLFNEFITENSSDWKIISSWILDRMFLLGIPPNYLIVDPKYLPGESLRFFHIDPKWIDCMIDGALSLANHVSQTDDVVRRSIKGAVNTYLETINPDLGKKLQVPSCGLLLRSNIIASYPELRVEVPVMNGDDKDRASILRQEAIGEGVLLCLFDRTRSSDELSQLTFTQTPRRQSFTVGLKVSPDTLVMQYRKVNSKQQLGDNHRAIETLIEKTCVRNDKGSGPSLFHWGENSDGRFLLVESWAQDLFSELKQRMATEFDIESVTSGLVGFQLGTSVPKVQFETEIE